MKKLLPAGAILCWLFVVSSAHAQLRQIETEDLRLIYYGEAQSYLVRHAARSFENALAFHRSLYGYRSHEKISVLLHDLYDYGNAGAGTAPSNLIAIGIAPFNYAFETSPANERLNATMNHELAHIVTNDQAAGSDLFFRTLFRGKILEEDENPLTILYAYLTSPRRSSPRWYREGIAVFLETWMAGGLGRALGGYDEMVFRAMVRDGSRFFDDVAIESEGTQIDFQVGANAYLYGTRFMTYLALKYGPESVVKWTGRPNGSKGYYAAQFQSVYGLPLSQAWQEWIAFERTWQKDNLAAVRRNPETPFRPLTSDALGSVSRAHFDPETGSLYVGVNYPGQVAHLMRLNVRTGSREMLHEVKGAGVFDVCALAYDPDGQVLFYSTDNSRWRDLRAYDLRTGEDRMLLEDARIGDVAFNRADRSLWGVRHFNGISTIARIPYPYEKWEQVYSWPYGKDFYDTDISPDGGFVVGALAEVSGRQSLIRMSTDSLRAGSTIYETLFDFQTSNPANFTFSNDGRHLYGSSYYTGVSNVFRYDLEARRMEVLSNAETGFFRPFPVSDDSVFVFQYTGRGFLPGLIPNAPAGKVGAIRFLGQEVVEKHPLVTQWVAGNPGTIDIDSLTVDTGLLRAARKIRLVSAYPVVEGYKDAAAVGLHLSLASPIRSHRIDLTAAYAPTLGGEERFHGKADFAYRDFSLSAGYNATSFYDLFGPTKTSRKGYALSARLERTFVYDHPREMSYTLMLAAYGGFERLPEYQNVIATFDRMQAARATLRYTNYRSSLGSVDKEKGFGWSATTSSNLVNGTPYPRAYVTLDRGFLLPVSHLSTWLRASAGASLGERDNPFANFYFGGFGNNWVDRGEEKQFRSYYSFPGLDLNAAGGTSFARLMNEWILPPIRFGRAGFSGLYLQWARVTPFGAVLWTNPGVYADAGGQVDVRIILFSHLKSTLSFGFAAAIDENSDVHREAMVSLKML